MGKGMPNKVVILIIPLLTFHILLPQKRLLQTHLYSIPYEVGLPHLNGFLAGEFHAVMAERSRSVVQPLGDPSSSHPSRLLLGCRTDKASVPLNLSLGGGE